MPCSLDRHHAGFGPGVGEANQLHRLDPISQQLGVSDLLTGGPGPCSASLDRGLNRFARGAKVIPVDHAQAVAKQIDIAPLVDVPKPWPIGAFDDHRIGGMETRGTRVASRQYGGGLPHQRRRGRSFAPITLFDEGARAHVMNTFARSGHRSAQDTSLARPPVYGAAQSKSFNTGAYECVETAATASTSSLAPSRRSETPTVALAGQSAPKSSVRTLA